MTTRQRFVRLLFPLAFTLTAATPIPALGQDAGRMDEIVRFHADGMAFMGSVLVARDGEALFDQSYGYANLEWDTPNGADTKFRIGSITKQFTAAAILLLAERGELDLDDAVERHLPDAPAAWDDITIFHLLTHTSGIPSFTSFPEYPTLKLSPSPVAKTVDTFRESPLEFEPGERMVYSNSGYLLLGHLIETISGQGYEDFLRDNIFAPLGMEGTGLDSNAAILPRRANGYTPGAGGLQNADFIHMSVPHGAGALYSTTKDLARWAERLFAGDVLSAESLERMTTPVMNNYGLGVEIHENGGRTVVRHGGGIEGFNTVLAHYPDERLTVVVLANVNGNAPAQIAEQLAAHALGDPVVLPTERREITLAPGALDKFAGAYALVPTANMMIDVVDGRLVSRLGQQPQVPLFAESDTRFFARVVDAQIEFELDDRGEAVTLILYQGGREMRAPRVEERAAIDVSPDVLERYVGTYELNPQMQVTITLEDGRLMSQATAQPKAELYAETEHLFFLKVADVRIEFVEGDDGNIEAFVLHQGGRTVTARRQ